MRELLSSQPITRISLVQHCCVLGEWTCIFTCLIYLEITTSPLAFQGNIIEELLGSIEVTPAEVAEELMRSCDPDVCLGGLVSFLKEKKTKRTSAESKDGEETTPESKDGEDTTPGVEIIPKAKKIKTNGSQNGLNGGCHPTPNGMDDEDTEGDN
ncbi:hypothetical protein POM88_019265 [Heracleum sosnowskyi]|uniref:AAA+ ATPase At3g28540-like C-terminal domain-containing protein n=1 Tax=Heracleum sosnowskyi TaxID=360622 RepID=A0AAD8IS14_9APIA|nr:hypothetical protein POM88_019265 [Heracleum sosnowskyi]